MERFISALPNSDKYMDAYKNGREKAKAMCVSPYAAVSDWFMRQFPQFRSNPLFYLDNQPEIIDFSVVLDKAKKKPAADTVK